MEITLYIATLNTGGAEQQTIRLAKALASRGHRVNLICNMPDGNLLDQIGEYDTIQTHTLFRSTPTNKFLKLILTSMAFWRLRTLLSRLKPDLIYSSLYACNATAALALSSISPRPLLAWSIRTEKPKKKLIILCWFYLCKLLSSRVDILFSNSKAGLDYHRKKGFNCKKYEIFTNLIDADYFCPENISFSDKKQKKRIGIVGRIDKTKNIELAIKAYQNADKACELDVLEITGPESDKNYLRYLKSFVSKNNLDKRIAWKGGVNNIRDTYRGLDILINSSKIEGFSNVLCEAMCCNVRCIATDVGDSSRIIGKAGVVINPCDQIALEKAIVDIVNNNIIFPVSPREHMLREFDSEVSIMKFETILESLIDRQKPDN